MRTGLHVKLESLLISAQFLNQGVDDCTGLKKSFPPSLYKNNILYMHTSKPGDPITYLLSIYNEYLAVVWIYKLISVLYSKNSKY